MVIVLVNIYKFLFKYIKKKKNIIYNYIKKNI